MIGFWRPEHCSVFGNTCSVFHVRNSCSDLNTTWTLWASAWSRSKKGAALRRRSFFVYEEVFARRVQTMFRCEDAFRTLNNEQVFSEHKTGFSAGWLRWLELRSYRKLEIRKIEIGTFVQGVSQKWRKHDWKLFAKKSGPWHSDFLKVKWQSNESD